MKKTYICPEAIVVNIDTESIIADSQVGLSTQEEKGDGVGLSNEYRTSIWGD